MEASAIAEPREMVGGQNLPAPLLSARGVTLLYRTPQHIFTTAWRVDFDVLPSDRFELLGPSGCGKSSILRSVSGFLPQVGATLTINGQTITEPAPDRMMVFQKLQQRLNWRIMLGTLVLPLSGLGATRPPLPCMAG
jgi:NitT/TauT family transport system ATP-binding protein